MNSIKKIVVLFLVFNSQWGFSQEEKIIISEKVSSTEIGFFDVLTVEFEINTNDAELVEPTFNDFDFYSQKSIASAVTIKNGIKSAKVTHKYYLKPKRIGLSTIEKVTFDYNGKKYQSNPIVINVKGETIENDPLNAENKLFIIPEISNYKPHRYQPITVKYKLYYDKDIRPSSIQLDFEKEYVDDFFIYSISENADAPFLANYNGKEYNCVVIRTDVLRFKELYDTYIHNKIIVHYNKEVSELENESILKAARKIIPVVSERIKVQNFENFRLPYNYVYPYGNYKIDVIEPEKTLIRKNKIFEVQVQVYGEGFLEDEMIPKLRLPNGIEVVSDVIQNENTIEETKIKTIASRTYKLKAIMDGKIEFKSIDFYFYDEINQQHKSIKSKEFSIIVK